MIEKSVLLRCPPERAFELFTQRMSDWWPPERRHTGDPNSRMVVEPTGRFAEISGEREVPLGRVLTWDPPARLELNWFPGTDTDHPTRVEITFAPEEAGTRVLVVHRPTPSSESLWVSRAPRYAASWDLVLDALASR